MLNKIDIVTKHNQLTGRNTTINTAMKRGLWHRGVHVVVCTKTGYVLVQKRSKRMVTHPGFIDFSVGGFVDTGEEPEEAALREVREEVGLKLRGADFHFLRIYRKNRRWPRLGRTVRAFVYIYAVILPSHESVRLTAQAEEVDWAKFITISQLDQLLRRHRLKSLGRLEPTYAFYRDSLAATKALIRTY